MPKWVRFADGGPGFLTRSSGVHSAAGLQILGACSSDQMFCQSIGRKSLRVTAPPGARSIATDRWDCHFQPTDPMIDLSWNARSPSLSAICRPCHLTGDGIAFAGMNLSGTRYSQQPDRPVWKYSAGMATRREAG